MQNYFFLSPKHHIKNEIAISFFSALFINCSEQEDTLKTKEPSKDRKKYKKYRKEERKNERNEERNEERNVLLNKLLLVS